MSLIDEPTRIYYGIVERVFLDKNGNLSVEYSGSINDQKYSMALPIKENWEKYPDIIDLVRKMARGYFDMLRSL